MSELRNSGLAPRSTPPSSLLDDRPWLPPVTASGCSYRGRKDEPLPDGDATVMVESGHFQRVEEPTS